MNNQVGYITTAHLILAGVIAGSMLLSVITSSSGGPDNTVMDDVTKEKPSMLTLQESKGKNLFLSKCASCHHLSTTMIGPALGGFQSRGPWADRNQLYKWIRNPEAFMKNDTYTQQLKKEFGSVMTAFPGITDEEVDAIAAYIN